MRRFTLSGGVSLLAAAGRLLLFFPFLNLAGVLGEYFPPLVALCGQGALWALAGGGYLLARLAPRRLPIGVLRLLAAALAAGAGYLLAPWGALFPRLLFAALCFASVWVGASLYGRSYSGILGQAWYLKVLLAFYLAAAVLFWWLGHWGLIPCDLNLLTAALVLALGIYALCGNQANIDYHMQRRRHRLELLPREIRRYNLRLTLCVLVGILLLFLLRGWVAEGLRLLLRGVLWLAAAAVWLFFKLLALFPVMQEGEGEAAAADAEAPILLGKDEGISEYWLYLLLALLAAFLLWRKRRAIYRGLCWLWRRCIWLVRRLVAFVLPRQAQGMRAETLYYTDEVCALQPEEVAAPAPAPRFRVREWKKAYNRYLQMPRGGERYRSGYRLVLQYLAARERFAGGDTVHELALRAAGLPGLDEYPAAADGYDQVRYGEQPPSAEEEACLQRMLQQIAAQLGKR